MNTQRHQTKHLLFAVTALLLCTLALGVRVDASTGVTLAARIGGTPVAESSESNPIRLNPLRPADISVTVRNETERTLYIGTVRLTGEVMSLTFFAYNTAVAFSVPPGHSVTNHYSLGLIGLSGQATGLIQGSISILDTDQRVLASEGMVTDVRGSLRSVYGLFGWTVVMLTMLALVGVLLSLARHKLPDNRFRRALRFLVPGVGVGLILVFSLSACSVFVPEPGHWVPLVLISSAVLFGLGYLTPNPRIDTEEEDEEDDLLAARLLSGAGVAQRFASAGAPLGGVAQDPYPGPGLRAPPPATAFRALARPVALAPASASDPPEASGDAVTASDEPSTKRAEDRDQPDQQGVSPTVQVVAPSPPSPAEPSGP